MFPFNQSGACLASRPSARSGIGHVGELCGHDSVALKGAGGVRAGEEVADALPATERHRSAYHDGGILPQGDSRSRLCDVAGFN